MDSRRTARGIRSGRHTLPPLALIAAGALLSGCASAIIPSDATINRDKIASIAEWDQVLVGHESAEAFAWDRTAMIIQGADSIQSDPNRGTGRTRSFTPMLKGTIVKRASAGAAAAIAPDGYWLTAAHCTEPGPLMIVHVGRDGELRSWPARIVWRAPCDGVRNTMDLPAERDLALLHTPMDTPIAYFAITPTPPVRGRILCLGSGVGTNAWSAGRITSAGGRIDDDVTLVRHTAPVSFGDSGGPAMLEDGTLVGVNVERAWGFLAADESTAAWIKPEVLQQLMDADRRRRGVELPTSGPAEGLNNSGL